MQSLLFILIALYPSFALGLVRGESITAEVLQVADKQLIISRGGSDALTRGEYVRVMQDGRYKGRAIAIQVLPYVSQWALYYVYEPIGYGSPVELKKSSPHPIVEDVRKQMNFAPMETARLMAFVPRAPARPINQDDIDPEQQKLDEQLAMGERFAGDESGEAKAAKQAREKLSKNLDELVSDSEPFFSGWTVQAGLSPASFRRVGGERDVALKFGVSTDRGVRELSFRYQVDSRSYRDQLSGSSFDFTQHQAELNVDYIRLKDHLSLFAYGSYERRQQGVAYPLRAYVNAGPIGIKYSFLVLPKPWVNLDLSYVPTFDYQKSDYPLSATQSETRSEVGLRHTFRVRAAAEFYEKKLLIKGEGFLRPMQDTGSLGLDTAMTHLSSLLTAQWKLNQYFSLSYANEWSREPRRRELQGISATDMVHTFFINFDSVL